MSDQEMLPQLLPLVDRIETTYELTLGDVESLWSKGICQLPQIEGGTKIQVNSEVANRAIRSNYLRQSLDIDPANVDKPNVPGKTLSERLVSDVIVDIITLCQAIKSLPDGKDPAPLLKPFNLLMLL